MRTRVHLVAEDRSLGPEGLFVDTEQIEWDPAPRGVWSGYAFVIEGVVWGILPWATGVPIHVADDKAVIRLGPVSA